MSGGVDSAVALLEAGPGAVGVTLQALDRPAGRRAASAPAARPTAVIAARATCHRLGLPARHARPARAVPRRGRRAVHARLRARRDARTPASAATAASASTSSALRPPRSAPPGSRPATTRASSSATGALAIARGADAAKDQSYMLATLDPAAARAALVPARRADEGRRPAPGRGRPGSPAAGGGREPGGLLPRRRRLPRLPRPQRPRAAGAAPLRRRGGTAARRATTASGASRRGSAAASASRRPSRSTRSRPCRRRTPSSSARAPRSRAARVQRPRPARRRRRRVEAKLRHRSPLLAAAVEPTPSGFELALATPAFGVARGQTAVVYEGDAVVGAGVITGARDG